MAALALGAAACGGSGDDGAGEAGGDGSVTTTVPSGTGDTGGSGGDGGAGDDGSATTAGDLSEAETVPLRLTDLPANGHGAPLPGRYLYDVEGGERDIVLEVRDTLGDQQEDSFDRTGDLGQLHTEYEGAEARASLLQWRASGVLLDAEQRAQNTQGGAEMAAVCDYQPDLMLQEAPLRVGGRWSDESSCTSEQGEVTLTRDRRVSGEVTAASTARVDGRTVETLRITRVVESTTRADSTPPLLLTERRELTIEWIVGSGLAARVEGTVLDTVGGSAEPPRTFVWVLRSVTPAG